MSVCTDTHLLQGVTLCEPRQRDGLQIFGLRRTEPSPLRYLMLDEALDAKLLSIKEIDDHGRVPEIRVDNESPQRIFLMSGEQLVGAKQDRILNVSVMLAPEKKQTVPVSCVEAGRWSTTRRGFASGGVVAPSGLRSRMARDISSSYRHHGSPRSNQGAVWSLVDKKLDQTRSRSHSSALFQSYRDSGPKLDRLLEGLEPEGASGAVFVLGDRIAGIDLFDQPATFAKLWPKIARGYAIDALFADTPQTQMTTASVSKWLEELEATGSTPVSAPGIGDSRRLENGEVRGGVLSVEGTVVHLEAFSPDPTQRRFEDAPEAQREALRARMAHPAEELTETSGWYERLTRAVAIFLGRASVPDALEQDEKEREETGQRTD